MTIIGKVRLQVNQTYLKSNYFIQYRKLFYWYMDQYTFFISIVIYDPCMYMYKKKKIEDCRYFHILFIFMFHLSK